MLSICAPGTAAAVRLLRRLETSVARAAIFASGITAGGAGAAGSGVVAGFCSAATPLIEGNEQTPTTTKIDK
jgi:hypothetical protein